MNRWFIVLCSVPMIACASSDYSTQPLIDRRAADHDRDGLRADDLCPRLAEDFDQFEDHDGCPEPDNDGDGVLDVADLCPGQAGSEGRGCPNTPTPRRPLSWKLTLRFPSDHARIDVTAQDTLRKVAQYMALRVQVRATIVGSAGRGEARGIKLARQRAQVVYEDLLSQGVEPERMHIYSVIEGGPGAHLAEEPGGVTLRFGHPDSAR